MVTLAERLDGLTFADLTADEVTGRIIEAVKEWGREQGWRVYERAPSVLPLPPPNERRKSVIDVALARRSGPPIVVEVDRTDRRRTLDKLAAEAAAGRVAMWVRWGTGRFTEPPPPIELVPLHVTRRQGRFSHFPTADRQPPAHSSAGTGEVSSVTLPLGPGDALDP